MTRKVKLSIEIDDIDEILNREVKYTGNGAYVGIPKEYIKRSVKVLILKESA